MNQQNNRLWTFSNLKLFSSTNSSSARIFIGYMKAFINTSGYSICFGCIMSRTNRYFSDIHLR